MKKIQTPPELYFNPAASHALKMHLEAHPNGAPLYSGKSKAKEYFGFIRIRETKEFVIVEEF